ncbi:AmmeMemoRadiSam system protein A [Hyperthermus butylicus]|uniref:Protein Hbut_0395 n=1 Tax=Hyperthermus butylicus (strain DSM 5456 / JCM 9403 / PLM1-5) TaxID=415426 RepID=A2BJV1_HYPBU|nr:AmmeMemoRadiSam system protein A [Hyperthermus butylicus]ABM80262.1 AMMECR1 family protein [Hyperthermus butylicus DSM 5456]
MSGEQVRPDELTFEEGAYLVRLARRSVEYYFEHGKRMPIPSDAPEGLLRPGAAFVTITTYYGPEARELRGCIGYVYPVKSLVETVIDVAVEAAFNDPRFPPMNRNELPRVTFEVSVLGPLEPLPSTPEERVKSIVIGRHGLVAKKGFLQGLLLPEVPVEYLWDEETFLAETCVKAGMPPTCWLDSDTEFYRFTSRAWREKTPMGEVEERDLRREYESLIERYGSKRER